MRFFLLFNSTPLTPDVPLKALTSQGMRFDVACRMLRACLIGAGGHPSGHSVSAWFPGRGGTPPVLLQVEGSSLDARAVTEIFRSELVLARHIKAGIAAIASGGSQDTAKPIHVEFLDDVVDLGEEYLNALRQEKRDRGRKVIMFHEEGEPVFCASLQGTFTWNQVLDVNTTIVVGDHRGFPENVEGALLSESDRVVSIGVEPRDGTRETLSYLGSHVIAFLQLCQPFPQDQTIVDIRPGCPN